MDVRVGTDAAGAAELAAALIARRLRRAVSMRGAATVAFSGGTTPGLMLERLALADVPWSDVRVFQVDERVLPDGHPDRNLGLLGVLPVAASRVRAMPVTAHDLAAAARRYAAVLPEHLDVVQLGLGDDGHTASWPPDDHRGAATVVGSPHLVATTGEFRGVARMTLTPRAVNAARTRVVLVTGAAKRDVCRRWLDGDGSMPIARVHRTGTVLVADRAALPA